MTLPNLQAPAKKKKRALPIRVEIVVPLGVMVFGIWFYFATMFDGHMRWLLQKGMTYANGAEVNVAGFDTSFTKASLAIRGLQMTDNERPTNNWLQIAEIRYALDWNGLLRAKFVVDDASIVGIGMNVPRKKAGFVVPKEPEPPGAKGSAVLTAAEDYFKATAAGTFFDDLVSLKSGLDVKGKLNALNAALTSEKKVQELRGLSKEYQSGWAQKEAQLKNDPEWQAIEDGVAALRTRQVKTPQELTQTVADAEKLQKLVEKKLAEVQAIGNQAQREMRIIDEGLSSLPKLVDDDVKSLQAQLKLPDIRVDDLSGVIFGKDVMATIHKALFYYQKAKSLYATVKAKTPDESDEEAIPVHERRHGIDYEFPIVNRTFPRFYVKRSELSVYEDGQTSTEAVRGVLTNLSSSPSLVAEPIRLAFSGNMSAKGIKGIAGEAVLDHRRPDFKESFVLDVAEIPVAEHVLVSSNEANIALSKASMALSAKGHLTAAAMGVENVVRLKNTAFSAVAAGKDLERLLAGVLDGVSATQVRMTFGGPWNGLRMDVSSDLGRSLQQALSAQFNAEVARVRQQVDGFVQERIQGERAALQAEFEKAKTRIAEAEKSYTALLKDYEAEANRQVEEAKKQLQGKAEAKVQEELSKKVKGLKLPGVK